MRFVSSVLLSLCCFQVILFLMKNPIHHIKFALRTCFYFCLVLLLPSLRSNLFFPLSLSFRGAKVGASLLSNTALGFGVEVIARLEQRNSGLRWDNVAEPIAADDPFNMGWVFGMLLIDSFLYMVVAWCVRGSQGRAISGFKGGEKEGKRERGLIYSWKVTNS